MIPPNHDYFSANRDRILTAWCDLLRIESVSADASGLAHCARAAAWLKRWLKYAGFQTEVVLPPNGRPIVWAERPGVPSAPAVLFYGHYDVQPADPVAAWTHPPFDPVCVDGRIYARGAEDNKGQLFAFLQGVAARIDAGLPLPTLRVLIEGEEECGSSSLLACAHDPAWRQRLAADILLVCDTSMHPCGQPAIVAGLRGMQALTVTLRGPSHDLHSGSHGGLAPNPAQGMARLIASLHDPQGRIAVSGFFDGWAAPTTNECRLAEAVPFDAAAYASETGAPPEGGERAIPPIHRTAFHPTLEVNGVHAGYGGPGCKTIIPSEAVAKLSARLCPGQTPSRTMDALTTHLRAHCPPGLTLELSDVRSGSRGFRLPVDSPLIRLATDVLTRIDPRGPLFLWEGASIPIIATLQEVSGAAPLLVGFGREEDRIHAPNESFGLDQFQQVMTYADAMLGALV
jgi:acetylornithine deacetylase/succinyl-diaminopimelate desuccinylase-like protein